VRRTARVTDHRAKTDFVAFVRHLFEQVYITRPPLGSTATNRLQVPARTYS